MNQGPSVDELQKKLDKLNWVIQAKKRIPNLPKCRLRTDLEAQIEEMLNGSNDKRASVPSSISPHTLSFDRGKLEHVYSLIKDWKASSKPVDQYQIIELETRLAGVLAVCDGIITDS